MSEQSEENKHDSISIIYHQRNDSPKYFEIKRSRLYLFFIGLPAVTLLAVVIVVISLINFNPKNLIESYRLNSKNRSQLEHQESLQEKVELQEIENNKLKMELASLQEIAATKGVDSSSTTSPVPSPALNTTITDPKCPPVTCPAPTINSAINSIGLSTLSLFKPIQGQKDRSRPAVLNLSGFKTTTGRDTVNLQFNIIPTVTDDSKISGHIIVLMKNELAIQAYPLATLGGNDFQINYSAGEPFSTQRFRPVDAGFVKPRKSGNYSFTVFIFSRTGDLIHYQSTVLPIKL